MGLDLYAKARVPQAHRTVLAACENIFRCSFGIVSDVHRSFVLG